MKKLDDIPCGWAPASDELYRSYHDLQQSSFLALGKTQPLAQRLRVPAFKDSLANAKKD